MQDFLRSHNLSGGVEQHVYTLISLCRLLAIRGMSSEPEHHEVVIVGGGTGGLFTARKLLAAGIEDVVVLESRGTVGGRVITTRDGDGDPLFNNFAWRISEENTMMLELCKELGLNLIPQTTPPPRREEGHGKCRHGPYSCDRKEEVQRQVPKNRAPLSDFAKAGLAVSAAEADFQDRNSGYAGRTSQISFPDESHGSHCWFVEKGMDSIPTKIAAMLPEGCVRTNHRATEIERTADGYRISAMKRTPAKESYTPLEFTCSQVVLAAPPYALRNFQVSMDMRPALFAVTERRGGHIYAKCAAGTTNVPDHSGTPDRIYRQLPDSILQQVISGDYGHNIFQAAYATDRFERVWRELAYHGPEAVVQEIKEQLDRISDLEKPPQGWGAIEEVYVRLLFVHRFQIEAHVNGKNKEELSMQAITPNPARLPGLFLVGEAFSPHQGWTEGALWTAEKAADVIVKSRLPNGTYDYLDGSLGKYSCKMTLQRDKDGKLSGPNHSNVMVYRGLVIDVDEWVQRHPGGPGMIKGHKGEDVSELFDNFHPGWPAPLATLFGLQVGSTNDY